MTTLINISPPRPCQQYSRHDLQRLLAQDMPADESRVLRAHVKDCAACARQLAGIEAERAEFFAHTPFARFAADHEARRRQQKGFVQTCRASLATALRSPRGLAALASAGALAMLLLWFAPPSGDPQSRLRSKGGAHTYLAFLVKEADGARRGHDGEKLHRGDRIQFLLRQAAGRHSMVLLGIDGRGEVSVYHSEALREQRKGRAALRPMQRSLILDDSTGTERFYLIFSSDSDPSVLKEKALEAARKLAGSGVDLQKNPKLDIDAPDLIVDSVTIAKVPTGKVAP